MSLSGSPAVQKQYILEFFDRFDRCFIPKKEREEETTPGMWCSKLYNVNICEQGRSKHETR